MAIDPAETPTMVKLGQGFHVRQAVDNIAWMDLGDDVLVVDALEQAHLEKEVFQAIASTLGDKPVRYVLITHPHGDHTALNPAFRRRFQAEIVSLRDSRVPPEGRWFEGPKRRALMLPWPGCHTEEDCLVWVPGDRVLFPGDIFGWGLIPLSRPLTDESARRLLETYERMIAFDPAVVVPGHGPVCGKGELARWVEYFQWLRREVAAAAAGGRSDAQIRAGLPPPEDMKSWWRFVLWKHQDSLEKVVQAVRSGRLAG